MSENIEVTIESIIEKQRQNYQNSDSELIRRAYEYAKIR